MPKNYPRAVITNELMLVNKKLKIICKVVVGS